MFCPRCSTENVSNQKYCRQCGLPLSAVVLTLEGRVEDAIIKLNRVEELLRGSIKALGIFLLLVLVALAVNGKLGLFSFAASAAFGLVATLPFLFVILAKLRSANRLLNLQDQPKNLAIDQSAERSDFELPPTRMSDQSIAGSGMPISVTEHTTVNLKRPEERR